MTPEETRLLNELLDRLRQAPLPEKDPEADRMIREAVATRPDIPYLLAQTVLIQDLALRQAEQRLRERESAGQRAGSRSFLPNAETGSGAPRPGPWQRAAGGMSGGMSGGSSFLRTAAATAAGVAGGALLLQGIQSLLGPGLAEALGGHSEPAAAEADAADTEAVESDHAGAEEPVEDWGGDDITDV